ncbi:MAG: hypothetical protein HY813_02960 [Candidatus Portnoybacteria bacterium]|nr:hypothetical protein [Candidatus Portnoybacteria bacterium]
MSKTAKTIYALATLAGTIIGVGLFGLPYITIKAGIWVMLGYFLVLTPLVIIIHQFFGEVALQTKDFLRLPSYAEIYLGKWGRRASFFSIIFGYLGAILAYLIVGGQFLGGLLIPILGGSNFFYTLIYFAAGAILIYLGIKAVSKIEFWGLILFFVILAGVLWRAAGFLRAGNLFSASAGTGDWFLPFGAILFSLWGAMMIPEIEEMLGDNKRLLRKIITGAILMAALVYLIFIIFVVAVTGDKTSPEALVGLGKVLGGGVVMAMFLFGVLTTFTSFISVGLTLNKVFWYDLKINRRLSWFIACFIPLFLFLIGLQNFIKVISLVGGVALAVEGVLIVLMYRKLKQLKGVEEIFGQSLYFLTYPLIIALLLGVAYEIIYFLK